MKVCKGKFTKAESERKRLLDDTGGCGWTAETDRELTWIGRDELAQIWSEDDAKMSGDVGDGRDNWRQSDMVQKGQADALIKARADPGIRRSNDKKLSRSSLPN